MCSIELNYKILFCAILFVSVLIYVIPGGDTVTAQIVDTAVVLPGDDLGPADECIDNLTDDRCRDAAEMDAANAMMALV